MKVRFKGVKIVQSCFRDESRENPGCVVFILVINRGIRVILNIMLHVVLYLGNSMRFPCLLVSRTINRINMVIIRRKVGKCIADGKK